MSEFALHLRKLSSMIGRECIYKEGGLILHVQIRSIILLDDLIKIELRRIPSVGFSTRPNRAFKIESVIEYISFHKSRLSFTLSGSELFFRKGDVKKIVKLAEDSPDQKSFIKAVQEVRRACR